MSKEVLVKNTSDGRKIIGDGAQIDYLITGQDFHSTWDSPEAFARYISNIDKRQMWHSSGWDRGDASFYGTNSMEEALELSRYGWKEGAEKIEKLRSRIQAANPKAPKLIKHGIAGATPNVPRAVAGNVFNMRIPDDGKSHKKPVITLMANMSANCGINKDMISNRAAVIAALVDEIENQGYSCEVMATAMSRGYKKFKAATTVIVKPSHQPVDLMKMSFALGHAAFFRRLVFADWGVEPSTRDGLGYGLGNAGGGFAEEEEELLQKGIYLLPSAETNSKYFKNDETSMTKGLPYLMQYLKEKGCPPFAKIPEWKDLDRESEIQIIPDDDYPEDDYPEDDD